MSKFFSLLDTNYGSNNFTICPDDSTYLVNPIQVDRIFDMTASTYKLKIYGDVPGITYPPIERVAEESVVLEIGFWPIPHEDQFSCENCLKHGPILIEKDFNIPRISFPLVDIACHYQISMDSIPVVCVNVAPVGYQSNTWRKVFQYVPIAIALLAALISLLCNIQITLQDDLFLALSNFALDWSTLRLKGSTTDIIFYAQYIFATGALNLQYPKFYAYFTSDFAWSWLLFTPSPSWMARLLEYVFDDHKSSYSISTSHYPISSPSNRREGGGGPVNTSSSTAPTDPGTASSYHPGKNDVAISPNIVELSMILGIDIRGLFLASLVFFGIFIAALALASIIFWLLWEFLAVLDPYKFGGQRHKILSMFIGFHVRFSYVFYLPLAALSFYQLMLPGPWYLTTLASLLLVFIIFGLYSYMSFQIVKAKSSNTNINIVTSEPLRQNATIFTDIHLLLRYGCFYSTLHEKVFYFFIIIIIYKVLTGGMVGLFQMSGAAQATVMLIMECGLLIFHLTYAPFADKITQFVASLVAIIRTFISALNILYIEALDSKITDRQRQFVAYTQICLHFLTFSVFLGIHFSRLLMLLLTGFNNKKRRQEERRKETESAQLTSTLQRHQQRRRHHRLQEQRDEGLGNDPYGLSSSSSNEQGR